MLDAACAATDMGTARLCVARRSRTRGGGDEDLVRSSSRVTELLPEGIARETAGSDRLGAGFVCGRAALVRVLRDLVLREAVLDHRGELLVRDGLRRARLGLLARLRGRRLCRRLGPAGRL